VLRRAKDRRTSALAIAENTTVTVIELETGDVLSTHNISIPAGTTLDLALDLGGGWASRLSG